MKIVLITGSNDGIGKATAKQLKARGWRVLLHGRDRAKLNKAAKELGVDSNDTYLADLANFGSVCKMAQVILTDHEHLDALVNNAGVYMHKHVVTADGFETTMQVNHFSHFLLTHKLLPLLKKAPTARVVNVSSVAHRNGFLELDNLDFHHSWDGFSAYATSKLANIVFSNALAMKLKSTRVTSNSLHPGVVNTKLLRGGFHMIGKPASWGAKTSVYLTDSVEVAGKRGLYFQGKQAVEPAPQAQDAVLAKEFWAKSTQLLQTHLAT